MLLKVTQYRSTVFEATAAEVIQQLYFFSSVGGLINRSLLLLLNKREEKNCVWIYFAANGWCIVAVHVWWMMTEAFFCVSNFNQRQKLKEDAQWLRLVSAKFLCESKGKFFNCCLLTKRIYIAIFFFISKDQQNRCWRFIFMEKKICLMYIMNGSFLFNI